MLISKIIDGTGEAGETEVWLEMSKDAGDITKEKYDNLVFGYDEINRMLNGMIEKPEKFCTKRNI
jgi:four helix bundle protein